MMEHYVTLFDSSFAPQGLALHRSLQRHAGDHTLWVICMDEQVEQTLRDLSLPDVRPIPIREVEDDALRGLKAHRSKSEYCWTLTPFSFDAVLQRDPSAARVTYIDADVWLMDDPSPVFRGFEASGAAVQITEHAYSPHHDRTATSGRYCVQFLTMDRDASQPVRRWWQERCIEWCFARVEPGRFGDQKYLDDWPKRFGPLVHVTADRSWFQAPWNADRFPYSEGVAYHFHGLRLLSDNRVRLTHPAYRLSGPHRAYVYSAYLRDLAESLQFLQSVDKDSAERSQLSETRDRARRVRSPWDRAKSRLGDRLTDVVEARLAHRHPTIVVELPKVP
jgi:hypothetical protein